MVGCLLCRKCQASHLVVVTYCGYLGIRRLIGINISPQKYLCRYLNQLVVFYIICYRYLIINMR